MKPNNRHAAYRLATRYEGADVDISTLEQLVAEGSFEYLKRQTKTRTLCKAVVGGCDVYFILDRPKKRIVTVLTDAQAQEHLY